MSLNTKGFEQITQANEVTIKIDLRHSLIKLAKSLPWDEILQIVLPDLKRTERLAWWVGRPLRIRIHLGIYLLQQMFNLTDRQVEYFLEQLQWQGHRLIEYLYKSYLKI